MNKTGSFEAAGLIHYPLGIGVGVAGVPKPSYFLSMFSRMVFKSVPFSYSSFASRAISTQTPQPKPMVSKRATSPCTESTKQFVLLVCPSSS